MEGSDVGERQRPTAGNDVSGLIQRTALRDRAAFDQLYARTSPAEGLCEKSRS